MFSTDIPAVWVDYADRSYIITRLIWFTGFMLDAPVNSHRTIELYLKGFLVSQGESAAKGKTAWGHDLKSLTENCARYDADFLVLEFTRRVVFFQRYFDMMRYPSDRNLSDGMIWFSFDSCIAPLDEIVAYVRPRIGLSEDEWRGTTLNSVFSMSNPTRGYQRKALIDSNGQINVLICEKTFRPTVLFNPAFNFDLPSC
jgi:hypothetical protein